MALALALALAMSERGHLYEHIIYLPAYLHT